MTWAIYSESADLLLECSQLARVLALSIEPVLTEHAIADVIAHDGPAVLLALAAVPPAQLVRMSESADPRAIMVLGASDPWLSIAGDLAFLATREIDVLCAGLVAFFFEDPWNVSTRSLLPPARQRLERLGNKTKSSLRLDYDEGGLLRLIDSQENVDAAIGTPSAACAGLLALRTRRRHKRMAMPRVESVDTQGVLEVLLGPERALSDPASKDALARYDMPMPEEVLCASASRAASEATRIGYPVRVALASPDLRVCDHPDLVATSVDNAARVRDVFKQIKKMAQQRAPKSRVLGVTVSATSQARTLLRVNIRSIAVGLCLAELAFADPHGKAANDATAFVLPCNYAALEGHLRTLRGHSLILGDTASDRKMAVEDLADVLLRAAVFADDWREEVAEVRLESVALLVGRGVEVREACVAVSDAFTRSLEAGL